MKLTKARSDQVQQLLDLAWHHESMEGDTYQQRRLAQWAADNGLAHLLPDDAHSTLHDHMIPHNHEGMENDENGMHSHTIKKAFNPISKFGLIAKSWDAGDDVHFEGWLSTPDRDLEKDETPPEAFLPAIDGYFQRRAPLSIVHQDKNIPIGHLRKAAIIKDGKVLKSAVHPTDPAEFEHLPSIGSGVWVRGVANEEPGRSAIRKGNVGGMSFIANASEFTRIPGGRYRYEQFNHWVESTVAPYPINPSAVIAVAKAFGLQETPPQKENPPMKSLEELLNEIVGKPEPEDKTAVKAITLEQLKSVLTEYQTSFDQAVEEKVQKAFETTRGAGVGRTGTVLTPEQERENDPKAYIVKKAAEDHEALSPEDKALIGGLTYEALMFGVRD